MSNLTTLANLGWQAFFQQQLSLEEWDSTIPARIIEQHKSEIEVATENGVVTLPLLASFPSLVVGDWILLNNELKFVRALERKTCFKRKAAGTKISTQLISANVDTAFIVSSMNDDFNLNRIERYLAVVYESGAMPVLVLSKSDLCEQPENFLRQAQNLDPLLCIISLNCLNPEQVAQLKPWLKPGETVAVIGSSGVGKSTLINAILGTSLQSTAGIREDDDKGRHTTTRRSLIVTPEHAMILDTPGMREIQLVSCQEGLSKTFSDLEQLAQNCRFTDCRHQSEPGCALRAAVEKGKVDQRRLTNYLKLLKEEAHNSASIAERRASEKALGRYYKNVLSISTAIKRGD